MSVFVRIKQLARDKKISISQIEQELRFGNGTIRRWDTNSPSIEKVLLVAKKLNVSVDYLLTGEDPPETRHYSLEERERILEKAKTLSDEDFKTLSAVIDALAAKRPGTRERY